MKKPKITKSKINSTLKKRLSKEILDIYSDETKKILYETIASAEEKINKIQPEKARSSVIPCIYQILNKQNGLFYIGRTNDFWTRIRNHIWDLNIKQHHSIRLQNDYNKYGIQSFFFHPLEIIDYNNFNNKEELECLLIQREQHWLNKTQCWKIHIGYNTLVYAAGRPNHEAYSEKEWYEY